MSPPRPQGVHEWTNTDVTSWISDQDKSEVNDELKEKMCRLFLENGVNGEVLLTCCCDKLFSEMSFSQDEVDIILDVFSTLLDPEQVSQYIESFPQFKGCNYGSLFIEYKWDIDCIRADFTTTTLIESGISNKQHAESIIDIFRFIANIDAATVLGIPSNVTQLIDHLTKYDTLCDKIVESDTSEMKTILDQLLPKCELRDCIGVLMDSGEGLMLEKIMYHETSHSHSLPSLCVTSVGNDNNDGNNDGGNGSGKRKNSLNQYGLGMGGSFLNTAPPESLSRHTKSALSRYNLVSLDLVNHLPIPNLPNNLRAVMEENRKYEVHPIKSSILKYLAFPPTNGNEICSQLGINILMNCGLTLKELQSNSANKMNNNNNNNDSGSSYPDTSVLLECCHLIRKSKRNRMKLGCLLIDIDDFYQINDNFGRRNGNSILLEICNSIYNGLTSKTGLDMQFYHIKGNRFLVLCSVENEESAVHIGQDIVDLMRSSKFEIDGTLITQTVSIGVMIYNPKEGVSSIISKVHEPLFAAKEKGKNQVISYSQCIAQKQSVSGTHKNIWVCAFCVSWWTSTRADAEKHLYFAVFCCFFTIFNVSQSNYMI